MFRHLVIARLAYPTSKLKTVDYLRRYRGIVIHEDTIYRFLDTLNKEHKEKAEYIAYEHTRKTLGTISVVFYDMTTLYFDAEDEDDLRKIGFSKDGKFQNPQIMVGLLVGAGGYPIGYDIFEGNTFEGKTLLPVLEKIEKNTGSGKLSSLPMPQCSLTKTLQSSLLTVIHSSWELVSKMRISHCKSKFSINVWG